LLVIVNLIPGQEERNADHFSEEGRDPLQYACDPLLKISSLLEDGARLTRCENVARLRRPTQPRGSRRSSVGDAW
jgi:hypothetical protein